MRKILLTALIGGLGLAGAAQAQQFTTAAEVRPILAATKGQWVAVREYDGQDLIYFTQLLSWRCGLSQIFYGLNDAPPTTPFFMEMCYEGTPAPNAIETDAIYIAQPLGSVQNIRLRLVYDDGTEEEAIFARPQVLMR
ncbi:hypothetical protein CKO11_09185 [Rhodobacter sp. TJ_12]|uniref:hypothetical protein n=1 Tax=Rhodobacter sp. TJ_12 TaxID=2029399 RepID=UPI001CC05593|nr:hypothetical protein [Rhodobacter sp. TJ_12]MBZ4022630.1 hypothetical protein [Rhodobacter sp. TJ_12]